MGDVFELGEHVDEAGQVVAVDGAHVFEAHGFENLTGPDAAFDAILKVMPHRFNRAADAAGETIDDALGDALGFFVGGADAHPLEIGGQRALGFADAHR